MITYWILNPIKSVMLLLGFIIGIACGYLGRDEIKKLWEKVKSHDDNNTPAGV